MIELKGLKDQEKLNSYIKDTLINFGKDEDSNLKMNLKKVKVPQCVYISLTGYIDSMNSNYFSKQCQRLLNSCLIKVIFDLKNLNYVSSTAIGAFIQLLKEVRQYEDGDVVLINIQKNVYSVFELLGLIGFFDVEDNIRDAIKYFRYQLR